MTRTKKNQFEFTQIVRLVLHTNYEFYNIVQIAGIFSPT